MDSSVHCLTEEKYENELHMGYNKNGFMYMHIKYKLLKTGCRNKLLSTFCLFFYQRV